MTIDILPISQTRLLSLAQTRAAGQKQLERLERRLLNKAEHLLDQPGMWPATGSIGSVSPV